MKKFMMMLALLLGMAATNAGDIDDIFGGGETVFEFEKFSDEEIFLKIDADAEIACNDGLCTLHSMTNKYGGWSVSFNLGEGSTSGNGGGTNIYTNGSAGCDDCPRDYWGIEVMYGKGTCTQTINVPRSVYYSINRYMYGLMTETGGTRRGFTPADQAMIIFYTTIISKATGCTMQNN